MHVALGQQLAPDDLSRLRPQPRRQRAGHRTGRTSHNSGLGEKVASVGFTTWLRSRASDEQVVTSGTGQGKRVFTVDPITVEVIDASLGRHHTSQCDTCPQRDRCTEGFWALRLDSAGTPSPCLLRPDLRLDITSIASDPAAFTAAVNAHLDAFTEGTL